MQRVFLDTCVLFPAHLRDTVLRLAEADLIQPLWSADVLAELHRNLAAAYGDDAQRIAQVDRLGHAALGQAIHRTGRRWRRGRRILNSSFTGHRGHTFQRGSHALLGCQFGQSLPIASLIQRLDRGWHIHGRVP